MEPFRHGKFSSYNPKLLKEQTLTCDKIGENEKAMPKCFCTGLRWESMERIEECPQT